MNGQWYQAVGIDNGNNGCHFVVFTSGIEMRIPICEEIFIAIPAYLDPLKPSNPPIFNDPRTDLSPGVAVEPPQYIGKTRIDTPNDRHKIYVIIDKKLYLNSEPYKLSFMDNEGIITHVKFNHPDDGFRHMIIEALKRTKNKIEYLDLNYVSIPDKDVNVLCHCYRVTPSNPAKVTKQENNLKYELSPYE